MRRGRQRKRLSRMDAAVDAMAQLGFTKAQVKKHVTQLLRVYGGDDGWPFIEECGYKELLESLLRVDEEDNQENPAQIGYSEKEKSTEDDTAAGTSSTVSDMQQDERPEEHNPPADTSESFSTVAELPLHLEFSSAHDVQPLCASEHAMEDTILQLPSGEDTDPAAIAPPDTTIVTLSENPTPTSPPVGNISSPVLAKSLPPRKHTHCYGWIESNEEDLGEFIFFQPATGSFQEKPTLPQQQQQQQQQQPKRVSFAAQGKRIRRSRWDEHPGEP
ncbi:uncharacterized protein LOC127259957 [Andrographis paniculata]|uniref:uncharacterized protein LOC127259957 n=1 Tax=Andrographis paniculata TaxID=175694 RepID=UPI0021E99AB7|nr:uncharacterized protein LOC127259957 [Andrographis paniculata]